MTTHSATIEGRSARSILQQETKWAKHLEAFLNEYPNGEVVAIALPTSLESQKVFASLLPMELVCGLDATLIPGVIVPYARLFAYPIFKVHSLWHLKSKQWTAQDLVDSLGSSTLNETIETIMRKSTCPT